MLQNYLTWITNHFHENAWMIQVFVVVLFTLVIHAVSGFIFKKLMNRVEKTQNYWDNTLINAINRPLNVLVWLLGLSFAIEVAAGSKAGTIIFSYVPHVRKMGVLAIVIWFALRFVRQLQKNYVAHAQSLNKTIDITLVHAVSQLVTISIIITGSLIGMQVFGLPISGLLAFGGIGGAGVAFASKDLLANFFGGLVIYLDRPFKVGDWIRSPDKSIEGTVEHIGWRVTCIRTFDKRPLYVPNGVFLTISVENPSRMTNRRIKTLIGVRYQDASKIAGMLESVESMLKKHSEIDTNQTLMVNFWEFGSSSLNFMVYTFTKTTNWVEFQAIQQDVFLKIISIIEKSGAECAFPTTTLHLPDEVKLDAFKMKV